MRAYNLIFAVLLLTLLISGCVYTHTIRPLTLDMHRTPVSNIEKSGSIKVIAWPPLFSNNLVAWGSAAIGDVAKEQGMKEIYFADLEIFSILRIWNEYTVHVYGK